MLLHDVIGYIYYKLVAFMQLALQRTQALYIEFHTVYFKRKCSSTANLFGQYNFIIIAKKPHQLSQNSAE